MSDNLAVAGRQLVTMHRVALCFVSDRFRL